MMTARNFSRLAVVTALTMSSAAFAAKPTSIKYVEDIVVDGDNVYAHYIAKCSNGEQKDLSAWDNRKQWCIGKGSRDECSKKQIKAAKKACK